MDDYGEGEGVAELRRVERLSQLLVADVLVGLEREYLRGQGEAVHADTVNAGDRYAGVDGRCAVALEAVLERLDAIVLGQ